MPDNILFVNCATMTVAWNFQMYPRCSRLQLRRGTGCYPKYACSVALLNMTHPAGWC